MTRLGVLNFGLRHIARPFLARTKTPERAERDFRRAAWAAFRKPGGLSFAANALAPESGDLPVARISAGAVDEGCAILYFHGGGYVSGSAWTHRGMLARISNLAGSPVYAPDYRLAQLAPFPAAFEDAQAAWRALRNGTLGLPADRIVLGGDSAGGGLALALLAALLAEDERPAGLFAFSPWTDLTLTGASLIGNEQSDAILPRSRMPELCEIVLAGGDPADPRISPLFARWNDPPPVYLQASQTEILLDDAVRMADHLRATNGDVTLDLWPDCPHVWQIFDGWIPEARDALERAGRFVRGRLSQPRPAPGN